MLDTSAIMIGNNQVRSYSGIGSVIVKMFDGTVKELTEVRHVPDLHKNLTSVESLMAKGYRVVIEAWVMKVIRGSDGVHEGNKASQFVLPQGQHSDGIAAVTVTTKGTTTLWYMRLAHVEETSLQALVKQGLLKGASICKLESVNIAF